MAAAKTGTIVASDHDGITVYASIVVPEGAGFGDIEYRVTTPLRDAQGNLKSVAQIKTELGIEMRKERNAQLDPKLPSKVAGLTGTVNS